MKKRSKVLITGGSGLIGSSFVQLLTKSRKINSNSSESEIKLLHPTHKELDISVRENLVNYFSKHKPDIVVNFAAHRNANTAQEQIHDKNGTAWRSNVLGVKNIVSQCKMNGIYLVHISTDMVFSGSSVHKGPYGENDKPILSTKLLSWYGYTKLLGERYVQNSYKDAAIVRIANVTKPTMRPDWDYLGKICYLYENTKLYPLFDDQYITITYIPSVVDVIAKLLDKRLSGIFHVASRDLTTPFDVGEYTLYKVYGVKKLVKGSKIENYLKHDQNRYPKHGGLRTELTQKRLQVHLDSWKEIVDKFAKFVKNNHNVV